VTYVIYTNIYYTLILLPLTLSQLLALSYLMAACAEQVGVMS
jgi:hypothetical protein